MNVALRVSPRVCLRLTRLLVAAGAAVMLLGFGATRAGAAATYNVVQCFNSHNVAQGSGVFGSGGPNPGHVGPYNACATGGGLGVYTSGAAGKRTYGGWRWTAPAGAYFSHTQAQHLSNEGNGWQAYYNLTTRDGSNGVANLGSTADWTYRQFATDASAVALLLQCTTDGGCTDGPQHVYARRIWFEMVDVAAPVINGLGGGLIAGGTRHGTESLSISTADQGSGVRALTISVNGNLSRSLITSCSLSPLSPTIAVKLRPCPGAYGPTISVQTDDAGGPWQEGANTLQVCAIDYSGQVACVTRTVVIDNSCPSSGAQPAAKLNGGVQQGGVLRSSAALRSNQDVAVGGTLKTAAGEAVNDATVCVYETAALPNATPQLVQTMRTRNGGHFAALLDRGPSRSLRFVYRYNSTVLQDTAGVRATVVPVLKVGRNKVRNGSTLRFRGRLPGPGNSKRVVAIQVRFPKTWRTFKAPRTNEHGRFRAAYQFVNSGTFRYTFRAVVRRQGGYPYEPGVSRKRRVLVIG